MAFRRETTRRDCDGDEVDGLSSTFGSVSITRQGGRSTSERPQQVSTSITVNLDERFNEVSRDERAPQNTRERSQNREKPPPLPTMNETLSKLEIREQRVPTRTKNLRKQKAIASVCEIFDDDLEDVVDFLSSSLTKVMQENSGVDTDDMESMRERLRRALGNDETATNFESSLEVFFRRHSGHHSLAEFTCLVSVVVACIFEDEASLSFQRAQDLGIGRRTVERAQQVIQYMKEEDVSVDKAIAHCLKRKPRRDKVSPILQQFIINWCHNNNNTRVDTNSKTIKTYYPTSFREVEGGGYVEGPIEEHHCSIRFAIAASCQRTMLKEINGSEEYQVLRGLHGGALPLQISTTTFSRYRCPCVKPTSTRTCVDKLISQQDFIQKAVGDALNRNLVFADIKRQLATCSCAYHQGVRDKSVVDWVGSLYEPAQAFVTLTTCGTVEYTEFSVSGHDRGAKIHKIQCINGTCTRCGIDRRFAMRACPILNGCTHEIRVLKWKKMPRNSGSEEGAKQRYQEETQYETMQFKDAIAYLHFHTKLAVQHVFKVRWTNAVMYYQTCVFVDGELVVNTDFSAVPTLCGRDLLNSSEAEHMVLQIICVLSKPRYIRCLVSESDNDTAIIRINECTHYRVIGSTNGKGKQNDHRFHHVAMNKVLEMERQKAWCDRKVQIKRVYMRTDNCGGQYKSRNNVMDVANTPVFHPGVELVHGFAIKDNFKGVHDVGQDAKVQIEKIEKETENHGIRCSNAEQAFEALFDHPPKCMELTDMVDNALTSIELYQSKGNYKNIWARTSCKTIYVSTDEDEYNRLTADGSRFKDCVAFCDRDLPQPICGKAQIKDINKVHSIRYGRKLPPVQPVDDMGNFEYTAAESPDEKKNGEHTVVTQSLYCACKSCMSAEGPSLDNPCRFQDVCGVQTRHTVSDVSGDPVLLLERRLLRTYWPKLKSFTVPMLKEQVIRLSKDKEDGGRRIKNALMWTKGNATREPLMKLLDSMVDNQEEESHDEELQSSESECSSVRQRETIGQLVLMSMSSDDSSDNDDDVLSTRSDGPGDCDGLSSSSASSAFLQPARTRTGRAVRMPSRYKS